MIYICFGVVANEHVSSAQPCDAFEVVQAVVDTMRSQCCSPHPRSQVHLQPAVFLGNSNVTLQYPETRWR